MIDTFTYDDVPPSYNEFAVAHWRKYHRVKTLWQGIFEQALMMSRLPPRVRHVHAAAVLTFTTAHRRDEGNYRVLIEKCLGDALRGDPKVWPDGRWLPDDTPEFYEFGYVKIHKGEAKHTLITMEYDV